MSKILAIDDKKDNLVSLKAMIHDTFPGWDYISSTDGLKGIELAKAEDPDVILLDIVMPDVDGFEVCRRLKENDLLRDIPVVFVTASKESREMRLEALETGAEAFLYKPVDEAELIAQIRAMVKIKTANRQKRYEKENLSQLVAERTVELEKSKIATLNLLDDLKAEYDERKKTEVALRASEARLKRAELASKSGNWELHLDTRIISVSEGAKRIYGIVKDMVHYDEVKQIPLPEYRPLLDHAMIGLLEKGIPYEIDFKIKTSDTGEIKDIHSNAIFDKEKRIVFGIIQDITINKLAETALSESEEKFRSISEQLTDLISLTDMNGVIKYASPSSMRLFGVTPEEMMGKNFTTYLLESEIPVAVAAFRDSMERGLNAVCLELKMKRKDGSIFMGELNGVRHYFGSQPVSLVTIRDISERKHAEEIINESNRKLARAQHIAHIGNWEDYLPTGELTWSEEMYHIMGMEPGAPVTLDSIVKIFPQDEVERFQKAVYEAISNRTPYSMDYKIIRPDGSLRFIHDEGEVQYDEKGNANWMYGTTQDITDRKLAEELLQKSEERHRLLAENATDVIWTMDIQGKFTYISPSIEKLRGYTVAEVMSQSLEETLTPESAKVANAVFANAIAALQRGEPDPEFRGELEQPCKDGRTIWTDVSVSTMRNAAGKLIAFLGVSRDITERKRADAALIKSEQRFKQITDSSGIWIWEVNQEGLYTYVSPMVERILGYKPDELIGKKYFYDSFAPEIKDGLTKAALKAFSEKQNFLNLENANIHKDGRRVYLETSGIPILDKNGNLTGYIGADKDITERKHMEEALHESEKLFRGLFENATIGLYHTTPSGRILLANPTLVKILGYNSFEELIQRDLESEGFDKDHPRNEFKQLIEQKGEINGFESAWTRKDGSVVFLRESSKAVRDADGTILYYEGTIEDITEQKNAEEALQESNELNQSLLKTIPFGMDIVDEEGNILFVSDNLEKLFGQDAIGKKCWNLYRDDKTQCHDCPLFAGIKIGASAEYESSGVMGGKTFMISHTGMLFKGKKAILEIFQDITDKKEAENKIKLLAHSLESVSECVSITDKDDIILYVNESFCQTYGYSASELIGQHVSLLRPAELYQEHLKNIRPDTIRGGWRGEILNRKKDGSVFPILLSTSVIKDENNNPIALAGVAIDMTEINKTQQELISAKEKAEESDRLKSVFLANISHEIRTPMNGIVGFANLLKGKDLTDEKRLSFIEVINSSSRQLLAIISDIVEISKIETNQVRVIKNPADINQIIDNVYNPLLILARKNKNVTLIARKQLSNQEFIIDTDEVKLQQILSNLVENALKFTESGKVEFGYTINPAQEIEFFVKDSGIGISKDNFDLVFDRFRKIENKDLQFKSGSGLGLAISKSYVELLGGRIWLDSELGKGTTFFFTIPKEQIELPVREEEKPSAVIPEISDIVLLVAEDDAANYYFIKELLSGTSIQLMHAWDGEEALEMLSKHPGVDMILMDIKMPRKDGNEATAEIRKTNKKIPIIAHTGYVFEEDRQRARKLGFDDYLCKPVSEEELLAVIGKYVTKKKESGNTKQI